MSKQSTQAAHDLMRSAWTLRRESFESSPAERGAALSQARQDLTTAASLLRDRGPPVSYAHALHLLANVEVDLGNASDAGRLWEQAIGILRSTDDVLQLAHKVRHLGDLHLHCNRLQDAEDCYGEALDLYRKHAQPGSLDFANAVRRVAVLKERQGHLGDAHSLWCETRDLYAAVGLSSGVEEAQQRISRLMSDDSRSSS